MLDLKKWIAKVTESLSSLPYYDVKNKITAATDVTINSAVLYVYGERVAQLYLSVTFSTGQTADGSYDIGTLDSSIYPRNLAPLTSTYGAGQISSAGVISFRPQLNLNAGTRYFASTYLLLTPFRG